MTDANQLQRAYEFIEADNLDEARAILEPIVADDRDNADAWWLYAHAVNDPDIARGAIQNVLRIDPEYPEAASLLTMLEQETSPETVTLTQPPLRTIKPIGAATPVAEMGDEDAPDFSTDDDDIDFDDSLPDEKEESKPAFRMPLPLLVALTVVGVIIVGLIIAALLNPTGTPPQNGGTSVAVNTDDFSMTVTSGGIETNTPEVPTSEGAQETEIVGEGQTVATPEETESDTDTLPSEEAPTSEGVGGGELTTPSEEPSPTAEGSGSEPSGEAAEEQLLAAFEDFTLAENPVETTETELGATVVVTVCSTPEELRTTAIDAMEAIAENSAAFTDVDAFAVRINNCETQTTLRMLGVSQQDAVDYADGTVNEDDFQSNWQPLG